MNTQPFGVVSPKKDDDQRGVVIDLSEVRRRLGEGQNPSIDDVLKALEIERQQVDQLIVRMSGVERTQQADAKHFRANVAEVVEPLVAKATKKPLLMVVRFQVVIGLVLLAVCLSMYFSFKSVYSSVNAVSDYAATKASWQAVGLLETELAGKATKAELKVVQTKADQSVVERLAQELRAKDGNHDKRLIDLATDLMSKANKEDVDKLNARLRATRFKVRSLEVRMKEISTPPPASAVEVDGRPKTM